jgi:hypothetical protein
VTENREPAAEAGERARFRALPEPVPAEDWVETVDARTVHPAMTEQEERDRMLREAGGGMP